MWPRSANSREGVEQFRGLGGESGETKVERVVAEDFQRMERTQADIARRHQSDPEKLASAARLSAETTLKIEWIAMRLRRGTRNRAPVRLQKPKHAKKTDNRRKSGSRPRDIAAT